MNKTYTLVLISLAILAGSAPSLASPPDTQTAVAMVGSRTAPVVVDDAAIQKAVESLVQKQQPINIRKRIQNKLDNPVGLHPFRNAENVLILGGAEAIPM